jgi:hypothetical protein
MFTTVIFFVKDYNDYNYSHCSPLQQKSQSYTKLLFADFLVVGPGHI